MRTARFVRRLGWAQLVIGLFLVGLMGTITFIVAPIMSAGRNRSRQPSPARPNEAQLILRYLAW
jgi:hypothetical protein